MTRMTASQRTADEHLRREYGQALPDWLAAQRERGQTYEEMSLRLRHLGVYASREAIRRWCADVGKEPAA